jgi:hypothetical protein
MRVVRLYLHKLNWWSWLYTRLFFAQEHLVTPFVPRKVTSDMNEKLCSTVPDQEIENALFMMHPNKSMGP